MKGPKKLFIIFVLILMVFMFSFPMNLSAEDTANSETSTTISDEDSITSLTGDGTTTTLPEESTSSTETTIEDSGKDAEAQPVLMLEIISGTSVAESGENFVYKVKVTNTGDADAKNINIQTHIPDNFSFVSATNGGVFNPEISNIIWEIASLTPGSVFESEIVILTPVLLADGTVKTLTVMAKSDELPTGSISADITVSDIFDKTQNFIELEVDCITDNPLPGEEAELSVNIKNVSTYLQTGVVLSGNIPEETEFVSASGNYLADGNRISWDIGEMSSDSSESISLVLKIKEGFRTNKVLNGIFKVVSDQSADIEEMFSINVAADDATILNGLIDFSVSSDNLSPVAGSEFKYLIKIKNNGTVEARNIIVSDRLDGNLDFLSASEGSSVEANMVTWNIAGIKAGEEKNLEISVKVKNYAANNEQISNEASFDCDQCDLIYDGVNITVIKELLENALEFTMTDDPDPVATGSSVTYTINYKNISGQTLTNVIIKDIYPAGTVFVSANNGAQVSNGNVIWGLGSLAADAEGSVNIVVNIPVSTPEGTIFTNTASIDSDQTEPVEITENTYDPIPYGSQMFYVFGWAPDILSLMSGNNTNTPAYNATESSGIHSVLSISNAASGTTVTAYLQNYLDKTPFDPLNPTSNPNVRVITINPGEVYTIDDLIYSNYNPTSGTWGADPDDWKLAGGDLLYISGGPVNVVRGLAPVAVGGASGNVLAEYWNLYPLAMWGASYETPVGVDTYGLSGNTGNGRDMEYTDLLIQAAEDGTIVTINDPVNGITTVTLNKGENYLYKDADAGSMYSSVHQNTKITSTKPIQAGLMTSGGLNVDTRNYNLSSEKLLGTDYYIPVSTGTNDRLYIYAFEDGTVVTINNGDGSPVVINLDKGQVNSSYIMTTGKADHITSNKKIIVLGACDSNGSDKDWGFQAISSTYYSSNYVTPYAPGDNSVGKITSIMTYTDELVDASETIIDVDDARSFSKSGYIIIDEEIIKYTSRNTSGQDYFGGLTRGALGTTATTHAYNAPVYQYNAGDASWNPLYVTPVIDPIAPGVATRVYVDWDGDGIADLPYAGAANNWVDLNTFQIAKLYDTIENDGDNGGALIWALSANAGGTGNWNTDKNNPNTRVITVYYGEQSTANSSLGYDWGYSLIPLSSEFVTLLLINKTSVPATGSDVYSGNIIQYTLNYKNESNIAINNVVITDTIPANTTLVPGTISNSGTESGGVITWNIGDLAIGAAGSVSFSVKVNNDIPADVKTIDNYGTIDSDQTSPQDSNYVVHNLVRKGVIELTKNGLEAGATAYFKLKSGENYYETDGSIVADPANYQGEAVTSSSNKITWNNLPWGTYTFEETLPAGYTGNTLPDPVTIDSSNAGVKVTRTCDNEKILGKVTLNKTFNIALPDNSYAGFTLYGVGPDGVKGGGDDVKIDSEKTISVNGSVKWEDLDWGTYYIKETTVPAGYKALADIDNIVIDENGQTFSYDRENKRILGEISITKNYVGATALATFFLLGDDGNYYMQDGTPVAPADKINAAVVFSTDGQTKTWINLPWQKYFVEENAIPNFTNDNNPTEPILIDALNLTGSRTVTNTYFPPGNPYSITINKTDNTGAIKLSGGVFQIKNSDGVVIANVVSDINGYAFVPVSGAGTYTIEEIAAPDGYSISANIFTVTLTASSPTATVNITNDPATVIAVAGLTTGVIEVLGIQELPFTGQDVMLMLGGFALILAGIIALIAVANRKNQMKNDAK